ncbi:MAG: hypothetical protein AB1422_16545 [bacterium]
MNKELSNVDIAVYALYLLDGWQKRVHAEDIALKCYNLAPSKFSWIKYPDYPDILVTYQALGDAKKPKYGTLVKGESERKNPPGGWMLTSNGFQWIKANKPRIEQYLGRHIPMGDRLPADRKLKELFGTVAFRKFREYGEQAEISHPEFAESLVCTVNTKAEILNDRLAQLYSIAEELKKEEVKKYVNFCNSKFALLLKKEV